MSEIENYIAWLRAVRERWKPVSTDKRENAVRFAIDMLRIDPRTADRIVYRPIRWEKVLPYRVKGSPVRCRICGQESYTAYWCEPCIHRDWCCECCILLMHPGYTGGTKIPPVEEVSG
ncbi:MAG: hypothetical protein JRD89_05285 [Deltaproteobacteria bacterium]|nr:hypothetical protein [Deltaproteobacteria bacterium]